jgi:hypothetical protein
MSAPRSLLFILSLCTCFCSNAQWGRFRSYGPDAGKTNFGRIKPAIDTINYEGQKVVRQRISREDLDKYRSPGDRDAVIDLRDLQDELDEKDGKAALLTISNLHRLATGINWARYEDEANVYADVQRRKKAAKNSDEANIGDGHTTGTPQQDLADTSKSRKEAAKLVESFGGIDASLFQEDIRKKSVNKLRVLFTGYSMSWYPDLPEYTEKAFGWHFEKEDNGNPKLSNATDKSFDYTIAGDAGDIYVHTDCVYNQIPIATAVTIKGNGSDLARLFLGYWEIKRIDATKLKPGVIYTHNFLSDRLTFNWKSAEPYISITPNPDYTGYRPVVGTQAPQDSTGTFDGTSMESILSLYGSLKEYKYQSGIAKAGGNKRKTVFTNHPAGLYIMMMMYVRDKYNYRFMDNDGNMLGQTGDTWIQFEGANGDKKVSVKVESVGQAGTAPARLATITGEPSVLANLFIDFWENKVIPKAKLTRGAEVSQDFLSDHIIFNWKGDKPFISITSNEED